MLKTILSVLAGYAVMAVGTMVLFGVLGRVAPDAVGRDPKAVPGTGALLVILAAGLLCALAGGWTTARIAPRWAAALGLVALVAAMGVVSWLMPSEQGGPAWYKAALLVVGIAGAALGAWLRLA
jgi:hypothetical protein